MSREEFEAKLGREINPAEYKDIEFVYNFHPSISETDGKKQIADLYKLGGIRLIRDMIPTARKAQEIEDEIRELNLQLANAKRAYEALKRGEEGV